MKLFTIAFCFLGATGPLFASGWVKGNKAYYSKVFLQDSPFHVYQIEPDSLSYEEKVATYGFYVEMGLPTPWPTQFSLSGSYKEITRKSTTYEDQFKSSAPTDWNLVLKQGLYSSHLAAGIHIAVALDLGLILPATPQDFRLGKEGSRVTSLDGNTSRSFLISGIDYGRLGSTQGLGLSFSWKGVWLNLAQTYKSFDQLSNGLSSASAITSLGLGVGLPSQSWVQLGYNVDRNYAFEQSAGESETTSTSLSGGYTFWQGAALELGFKTAKLVNSKDDSYPTYTAGLSYRSI